MLEIEIPTLEPVWRLTLAQDHQVVDHQVVDRSLGYRLSV